MSGRSGASRWVVAGFLGAVLMMSACSSDDEPPTPVEASMAAGADQEVSALEQLSGEQLCELLTTAAIERELDTTVAQSESTERGRAPVMQAPYFLTRECDYETDTFDLSTEVTTKWDENSSDQDVLDDVFTDPISEPEVAGEYQQLPGLGEVAGYGPDATLAEADVAKRLLGVVFYVGEERLLLTVHTLGQAELAQLQPLAEELLSGLENALK